MLEEVNLREQDPGVDAAPATSPAASGSAGTAWDSQPYSVKRHGGSITVCDAEPVRTPGCVQAHGALLVLRISDLSILQASENLQAVLGHAASEVLGKRVSSLITAEFESRLRNMLATEPTDRNPIYACTLPANGQVSALDVTLHTIDGVALVEFEPTGRASTPVDAADASLGARTQPNYYAIIKKTVATLQTTGTLQQFCQVLADEVRVLSGMDRVMIYKFHADHHGEVVAESRQDDLPPWLGLHYPAEDIPKPARDIFAKTWIRPIPDIAGALAEMMPLINPDTGKPLDMTYCALRGVSVLYTEYLQNMGVSAGLTMPLRGDDMLWGLIACHHYSGPREVPYQLRAACEFLAQVGSLQLQAVKDRENADYRIKLEEVNQQLLTIAAQEGGLASMTDGTPSLLSAMNASGAALYHRDRWWVVGQTPNEIQLNALAAWLVKRLDANSLTSPLYATESLAADFPPGAAYANVASGVLAALLSRSGQNLMIWFRPEVIQTVNWGGNPNDKPKVASPHGPRPTPRRSFESFAESVRLHAFPWLQVEIDAASRLRALIMELVITRAERLSSLNADLARSNEELDAFAYVASHDLKEPLRGIHKYAYQLLETASSTDQDGRSKLEGMMRLTLRMDNLLDSLLHFSRVGREELTLEEVDLSDVLAEAIEMVGSRTSDKRTEFILPRPLPRITCDRVRVREVLVNLLSNALKYNDEPAMRIEVGFVEPHEVALRSSFPLLTIGHTVYYVRDNGIGMAPRHFEQVFKMFKRLHGREHYGGGTGAGLTIVRKLVERHGGVVWPESVLGEGSTFYFTLDAVDES